jgi:hypothetical protein
LDTLLSYHVVSMVRSVEAPHLGHLVMFLAILLPQTIQRLRFLLLLFRYSSKISLCIFNTFSIIGCFQRLIFSLIDY